MKLIVKFEREKKEREFVHATCFHCGVNFAVHQKNIRAVNFCSNCK